MPRTKAQPPIEDTEPKSRIRKCYDTVRESTGLVSLVGMILIGIITFAFNYHDSARVQAQEIESIKKEQADQKQFMNQRILIRDKEKLDQDNKIDNIDKKMLTRELFEAYHQADVTRFDDFQKRMERIVENQH